MWRPLLQILSVKRSEDRKGRSGSVMNGLWQVKTTECWIAHSSAGGGVLFATSMIPSWVQNANSKDKGCLGSRQA